MTPRSSRVFALWARLKRAGYTRWYARKMHIPNSGIEIGGPCLIHGGGRFEVGKDVSIRSTRRQQVELYCAPGATLRLADGCFLNQGVHIACCTQITIGERSLVADEAYIMDSDFHGVADAATKSLPVVIERDAWVGARAIILKGVIVGEGAVVGAGAVVSHAVPPRSLVVGNPARVVRQW